MDLAQAVVSDQCGARRAHAEQQACGGALRAGQVPGVREHQPRNLDRPWHGKEYRVGGLAGITHAHGRRLAPAQRVREAGVHQQVGTGGGAPPRRGVEHAPQLPDLPQQQARRGAARRGLLREQGQAQLVELDQRLERLGVQPAPRQVPGFAGSPVVRLALQ